MIHQARDVAKLSAQLTQLDEDRALRLRLRAASLATAPEITWAAAGKKLLAVYRKVLIGGAVEDSIIKSD